MNPALSVLLDKAARMLMALCPNEGFSATHLPNVQLLRANHSRPAAPVLQKPTLVIAIQGCKRGYLPGQTLAYHGGQCLVVSVPMHFSCDTEVADHDPMLALAVDLDLQIISELLSKVPELGQKTANISPAMDVLNMDENFLDTSLRLITTLSSPIDSKVLGSALVRELHYRTLLSSAGACLVNIVARQTRMGAIHRAIERIQLEYPQELDITQLASEAAMSHSAFHQSFKQVTGQSPIQYLKATRLQNAHTLLLTRDAGAAQAAYAVGYTSPSQFSREYKRHFGYSPAETRTSYRDA